MLLGWNLFLTCEFLPDVANFPDEALDCLGPDLALGQGPGADIRGPDQGQEPLVGRDLGVEDCQHLVLILPQQPGVHQVLEVREPLLDPEADGPGGHAVGEEDVADDVPPHEPLALLLAGEEGDDQDGHAVRPGQECVLRPPP